MKDETYIFPSHDAMVAELSIAGRLLKELSREIQELYLEDQRPWIIGFSGEAPTNLIFDIPLSVSSPSTSEPSTSMSCHLTPCRDTSGC